MCARGGRAQCARSPADWSDLAPLQLGRPAFLDVGEVPYGNGDGPDEHEEPDDRVADEVEVEVGCEVPDAAGEAELVGEHGEQLDRPDQERDGDRQAGDGDAVEDLANRPRERPAV